MSLILGVSRGEQIFMNDVVMDVLETSRDHKAMAVEVLGRRYNLCDQFEVEILPSIFASVGKPRFVRAGTLTRIAIDAPRASNILTSRNRGGSPCR